MNDQESEARAAQAFEEAQSQGSLDSGDHGDGAPLRTIRYMDDDTFHRSLNKVVETHARLLAKLAE